MATFTGEYTESFTVSQNPDTTKRHFANLSTIASNYGPLDSWAIEGEDILHVVLKTQKVKGNEFTGNYKTRYHFTSDNVLEWSTVDGNMDSHGKAVFSEVDGGTKVDYVGVIAVDVNLGRLISKVVNPIARKLMKDGIRDYVSRMKQSL